MASSILESVERFTIGCGGGGDEEYLQRKEARTVRDEGKDASLAVLGRV